MIDGLYERIHETVTKEAQKAERRWNNFVDADDIEQELWMFIMTRPSVQEYLIGADIPLAASALATQADSICSKERLAYDRFTGNWTYNVPEVKSMLQRYNTSDPIPDEERFDLEEGLKQLKLVNPDYYQYLYRRYWEGESVHEEVFRKQVSRASEKLTDIMNAKRSAIRHERHEGLGTAPVDTINREDY